MSFLPLYDQARKNDFGLSAENGCWEGHPGLWYDKFFNLWNEPNCKIEKMAEGSKKQRVKTVTGAKSGHKKLIGQAITRQKNMVEAQGGQVLPMELTSPMVTGLGYSHPIENGFLWHPTLACPFLPGSSIKGLIRAWAESWCGENADRIKKAFGSSATGTDKTGVGELIFFDALPTAPVQLVCEVMNPHIGQWRLGEANRDNAPSDWKSPIPIFYLAIEAGASFQFALSSRTRKLEADDLAITWLKEALDYLGAGAKTGVGFGRFLDEERLKDYEEELSDFIDEQRGIEEAATKAEALAPPHAGEKAWYAGEPIYIHSVEGDTAWVIFLSHIDDDTSKSEPDEDIPLADLKPVRN